MTSPKNALQAYVEKPQPAFEWHNVTVEFHREIRLTSQEWKGSLWKHDLVREMPLDPPRKQDTAFLVVTGDRAGGGDMVFGAALAAKSRLPVLTLFDVPNQPLFDRREDALIAYTFEQYLETGDRDWPLLFPMVNSVKRAMDAAEQAYGYKHFIVSGGSKRGWTTWLTGALGDPRVVAIAPVAFDNLNFPAQLEHQMKSWGHLSEMLQDYVSGGLTEQAGSEEGKKLVQLVDPYWYLADIHVPVLMVRGANDRYWAPDATSIYWDTVPDPKELLILPNEGHDFTDDTAYIAALADLAEHYWEPKHFPVYKRREDSSFVVGASFFKKAQVWFATSDGPDMRGARWAHEDLRVAKSKTGQIHSVSSSPRERTSKYLGIFQNFIRPDGSEFSAPIRIIASNK